MAANALGGRQEGTRVILRAAGVDVVTVSVIEAAVERLCELAVDRRFVPQ